MKWKTFAMVFALSTGTVFAQSVEWGYNFPQGPAQWGTLPGFSSCALGAKQSPIAIETGINAGITNVKESSDLPVINPSIDDGSRKAAFNGHTVQADLNGSAFSFDGTTYNAAQFHFHSPSEHLLNERQYPLEAHFVHKSSEGKLLVLGVFFEEGSSNPALEETWRSMEEKKQEEVRIPVMDFFPRDLSYVTYEGSLTTPPCSEGVRWIVLKTPVEASRSQLSILQKITGGPNNRPIQGLNGRAILTDSL